jgi:hypothetical protein
MPDGVEGSKAVRVLLSRLMINKQALRSSMKDIFEITAVRLTEYPNCFHQVYVW